MVAVVRTTVDASAASFLLQNVHYFNIQKLENMQLGKIGNWKQSVAASLSLASERKTKDCKTNWLLSSCIDEDSFILEFKLLRVTLKKTIFKATYLRIGNNRQLLPMI